MTDQKNSLLLAIESSCDETSVALIQNGQKILSNIVASQVKSHQRFGGVVPEVASRHHVEQITLVSRLALEEAQVTVDAIDAIAVTQGPGLVGALLVGLTAAKTLSLVWQKPLIAVNHLAGHIYATQLQTPLKFPLLALIVSGGHTELVYMAQDGSYEIIGETHDDAVGEAYDKVGRLLDLPYPAGKYMDELAQEGEETYEIPRAMIQEDNLDFSFSGMKSSVMNTVHNAQQRGEIIRSADLATSFQRAVVDVLVTKTRKAFEEYQVQQFLIVGGVAANSGIRQGMKKLISEEFPEVDLLIPPLSLCGDNAAMIGAAGHYLYTKKDFQNLGINAHPGLFLDA